MKINNRQQLLTILALVVVGLFAADKLLISPLARLWMNRAKTITNLRKQVADGKRLQSRSQSLNGRWAEMRTNTFPNNPSLTEQQMLNAFDKWAQESRINVTSLSSQWKHDSDDYMTLQCKVEAVGSLTTVSQFLYDIEKDPTALRLDQVELSSKDNEGQSISLALSASALVLTPQTQTQSQ